MIKIRQQCVRVLSWFPTEGGMLGMAGVHGVFKGCRQNRFVLTIRDHVVVKSGIVWKSVLPAGVVYKQGCQMVTDFGLSSRILVKKSRRLTYL
jgi:hypothetical protein